MSAATVRLPRARLLRRVCHLFLGCRDVSYKKLWKLLIDRDMKKKDLEAMAQVSHYTMNKLVHGDNVTTDVLGRICKALDCSLDDIMEFVDE